MDNASRVSALRGALIVFGLIFLVGIYPLMVIWPSGWQWTPNQSEYEQMIVAIYATLGVFLLMAAKDPLQNLSLIWFTVWSSFMHGGVMAVQAWMDKGEHGHFVGDIPALFIVAIVLAVLTPRRLTADT